MIVRLAFDDAPRRLLEWGYGFGDGLGYGHGDWGDNSNHAGDYWFAPYNEDLLIKHERDRLIDDATHNY